MTTLAYAAIGAVAAWGLILAIRTTMHVRRIHKWRKDIKKGDRCWYRNLAGGKTYGRVTYTDGKTWARIETDDRSSVPCDAYDLYID